MVVRLAWLTATEPLAAGAGESVAIWGDLAAVGASGVSTDAGRTGAVYLFVRTPTGWVQAAGLTGYDLTSGAQFGATVALQGDLLAVGAPGAGLGVVFVFHLEGSEWRPRGRLSGAGEWRRF